MSLFVLLLPLCLLGTLESLTLLFISFVQADQRSVIRLCLGAELGAGAEISFIFGFTNTILTEDLVCGSIFADVDLAIIASAGTAVGIGKKI